MIDFCYVVDFVRYLHVTSSFTHALLPWAVWTLARQAVCERQTNYFVPHDKGQVHCSGHGKITYICEYGLYCSCKQMLLDGIQVVFIRIYFELDILQMGLCSLFLCPIVYI